MHRNYLGDSYDIVKRFWAQSLVPLGPLFAHPRFVPEEIRTEYTAITTIAVMPDSHTAAPGDPFGILLDPDTGIPLPDEAGTIVASASHASLPFLVSVLERLRPSYLICFDQSYHRRHRLSRMDQLKSKIEFLTQRQIHAFYYHSHAPFLFATTESHLHDSLQRQLQACGIPEHRLRFKTGEDARRKTPFGGSRHSSPGARTTILQQSRKTDEPA
jgi:hypothetical protein